MEETTVGEYLIHRLEEVGLKHLFGIPGDYVLGLYDLFVESDIDVIGTATEIGAGYAADAYARINGLGCACVTYCVGGLNLVNAVAGAYAEKSPLIVISGAPGLGERITNPLLHHKVKSFYTQYKIYEKLTVASVVIEEPSLAPHLIDETIIECIRQKRPVYIEIPRDVVHRKCPTPKPLELHDEKSDSEALKEAISEAKCMLSEAKNPVILGGVEIHRFGLQERLLTLVESCSYPIATTLLGKSIISERHPQYIGVYEGAIGLDNIRSAVENSDCLLMLGAFMTDINLGIGTASIDISKTINATSEKVRIKHHHYEKISLSDFIEGIASEVSKTCIKKPAIEITPSDNFSIKPEEKITVNRFFSRMNSFLEENNVVISDTGDSLFGSADLKIHRRTEFISPAYYTSMGFAVPAAIGAQIRNRELRPIVFVGDGAFQMSCQELSTIVKNELNPMIFVLNNKGYTTERFIRDGPYNDINNWDYHLFPQIVRNGWGCEVRTELELEDALKYAKNNTKSFSIINIHLDKLDCSDALVRLGKRLDERV
ncbi:MAG: thiamine pyrophosphate-binding protein [Halobacteriota archaeon]|nr:thiamine pyrophosphate-binding protein [Halobacteriota archaeon]